ncbi:uncharacterized protein L201_000008 [Kwoniella dendrophila CBS 6074]|uniref:Alpha 1,2-mannosyltransferase n=1 Tax=Kwoniella dendrophila CBS 6074 TaxID=1295534 RepID=A0AAX4JI42_9TREE
MPSLPITTSSKSKSISSFNNISTTRRNPQLHLDLSAPIFTPSSTNYLSTTSPVNHFRLRSPSPSKDDSDELLPTPNSLALPSPSNPFAYEFTPSPIESPLIAGYSNHRVRKWIRRRMMKRNFQPTPLGYGILLILTITILYTFNSSSNDERSRIPSGWRSKTSSLEEIPYQDSANIVEELDEELEIDQPTLPSLPSIYSNYFPSLSLPSTFLSNPEYYKLAIKLNDFLHRPILNHEEAKEKNYNGCPRELSDKLVNPDQYNGDAQFWIETVDQQEIVKRRYDIVRWITERIEKGEKVIGKKDGLTGKGRGIVLTGGNQDTTLRTITAIKHLRRLKVTLPIEVFHYSDELTDGNQRNEIEALGATLREAKGLEKVEGVWKNWQIKGLALVQSSFREILYLDSDNVPLRSPVHLFDSPVYKDNGRAVFWPDLSKDHPDNAIWRIVGDECSLDLWTFESGQIIIDKSGNNGLNLVSLIIASGMMNERDFWFKMCGGDKDTFRWAFRILDNDFGISPRWMSALGIKNGYEGDRFCGHSVLQYDLDTPQGFTRPPPLFVHSNLLKHLGSSGLGKGSLFTQIRRMSNDYTHNPSLNYAHSWVYIGEARGMCLDLDWHNHTPDEIKTNEWPETIGVYEEEGGVFDGFEDSWFDEGGRIGGW